MDDRSFSDLMSGLWGGDPDGDLWEVAAADTDPVGSEVDPRMEARCERSIAAQEGDLLMPPPDFGDGLVGIFGATSELADRDDIRRDNSFPVDPEPGEETF